MADINQQAVRLFLRGVEAAINDARKHLGAARAGRTSLPFRDGRRSRPAGGLQHSPKGVGERAERGLARTQTDHIPHGRPALPTQRWQEPSEHERRLATARCAAGVWEGVFDNPEPASQTTNISCSIPAWSAPTDRPPSPEKGTTARLLPSTSANPASRVNWSSSPAMGSGARIRKEQIR
jgi:hypothetical protein